MLVMLNLLLNLVLFAAVQGLLNGGTGSHGHEPARLAHQIGASTVKILSSTEVERLRAQVAVAKVDPNAIDLTAAQPCLELGDFAAPETARVEAALNALNLGERLTVHTVEVPSGYAVLIPPLKSRADAERRVTELRKAGISNATVITSETAHLKFAVQLGPVRSAEAAATYVKELAAQGVRDARVADTPTLVKSTRYQLRQLEAPTVESLSELAQAQKATFFRRCTPDEGEN
jgi:hypothetical protein